MESLMTASGRMSGPKNRSNRMSAEPEWGLNCGCLASRNNPLTVKTLIQNTGCLVTFKATCVHLSPLPPPLLAVTILKAPPARAAPSGDLHLAGVPSAAACLPCLVLAIWNRTFSLAENIIVFLATCLILQSQYLQR